MLTQLKLRARRSMNHIVLIIIVKNITKVDSFPKKWTSMGDQMGRKYFTGNKQRLV